jgi:hypothetical protein
VAILQAKLRGESLCFISTGAASLEDELPGCSRGFEEALGFEEVFVFVGAAEIAGVEPGSLRGGGCAAGDGGGSLNFER